MSKTQQAWDTHYLRARSTLFFPDENLVRILARYQGNGNALDFGAGSGRHCQLLTSLGYRVTAADYSENSISAIQKNIPDIDTVLLNEPPYPFADEQFDVLVNWGVLHYNPPEKIKAMIAEFQRIVKKGGLIAGTVRSDSDTHLQVHASQIGLTDLKNAYVHLYSLPELQELFSDFDRVEFGYMQRTPIGELDKKICHWIFQIINS